MKKKNLKTLLSIIFSITSLTIILIWPDGNIVLLGSSLSLIIGVIGIILGYIGKKQIKTTKEKGKNLATTGIIIGILSVLLSVLAIFGFLTLKSTKYNDISVCTNENTTKDCVDNGDGTSTCKYMDVYDILCSTEKLKDNQFKKGI